tara:strand:- start:74 stop:925 length:852 start_codon:yes stop_codon:yes gene_type:complete
MSWSNVKTGEAVSKESSLEIAKALVRTKIQRMQERDRAHLCTLLYGEAKCGKSGLALDSRTPEQIENNCLVMVLDFDNGCEPTWRQNWDSDPNIMILNPVVRDEEGYPNLDETTLLAEAFISLANDYVEEGKEIKFVFDGVDRWEQLCFLTMSEDKRSTQVKFMPMLWGKRNRHFDGLIEKITDGLDCDRFFITHMKDVYEGINNPNPTGKIPALDSRGATIAKMNQVIEVSRLDIGNKSTYSAKVHDSKTNTKLINTTYNFLTVEDKNVEWTSIEDLQKGEL